VTEIPDSGKTGSEPEVYTIPFTLIAWAILLYKLMTCTLT
jgi:hypothetical protein